MKNFKGLIIIIILITIITSYSEELKIGTNDYSPYTYFEGNKASGFCNDLTKDVFQLAGYQINFRNLPWGRITFMTKEGYLFAANPFYKTPEREKDYYFTAPLIMTYTKFYYLRDKYPEGITWEKLTDLKGYKLGSIIGYWYLNDFDKNGLDHEPVALDIQNIKKLFSNSVDLIILEDLQGKELIKREYSDYQDLFATTNKNYSSEPLFLMVSKKYPNSKKIIKDFNTALKKYVEDGKYDKLLKKYKFPENLKPEKF